MKILFVSETWLGSCARSIREALSRYPEIEIDELAEDAFIPKVKSRVLRALHRVIRPLSHAEFNQQVLEKLRGSPSDFLVTYKGNAIHTDLLRAVSALGVKTVNIYPDCSPHTHYRAPLWRRWPVQDGPFRDVRHLTLGVTFIVGGAFLKYGILKPVAWGSITAIVPGAVTTLGPLVDLGFAILALLLAKRGSSNLRIFFWLAWPVHFFLCVLSLSKTEIMLALLLPALGAYMGNRNPRKLGLSVLIMALVFLYSQSWVSQGRAAVFAQTGTITQAGYVARTEMLSEYISGYGSKRTQDDELQSWWYRLSFTGVQAYGMRAYDAGLAGSTLNDVWMLFVPRFVWPDKPIVEGPGKVFHALVNNRQDSISHLALSVYGDLYWQFGWLGVVVISPLIGWFFGMMSWRSIAIMRQRDFMLLPLVMIALQAGSAGMNKYLVNGIIAVIPMYFAYLLTIRFMQKIIRQGRKRPRHNAAGQRFGSSL
jgi:hypothetical protein